ncbi:MAG: DUF1552 domain-containing protein [Gammaproteobacteria bacterium]|nr:DUF1552 domain-containing protein [Gammaproteobacteria bacterium]
MMIFKKSIQRRTFLRGAGASIALPVLDAMFPALATTKAAMEVPRRFSIVYIPNGVNMAHWTPKQTGKSFDITRAVKPLASYQDKMLMLTGLSNTPGDALPGEGETAPHERAGGVFLTGVHPLNEGRTGISIDQIVARELGKKTQLASLEMGLHSKDVIGNCEKGWSCAYLSTLSWRTPTTPMPMEYRPRAVFERLFGGSSSTDREARMERIHKEKSILDDITREARQMMNSFGPNDKARLTEYLDGMRDVERRIQLAEQQSSRELPTMERPSGIPNDFVDHLKLMFDLQVLAFQTDMTRMITFMTAPEQNNRTYGQIGVPDVHHSVSHHRDDPSNLEKLARIDEYHSQLFSYYLDKLRDTQDVDGSLLDNMIVMYGAGMSDGNQHLLHNLPIMLVGGGSGQLKGGRHIKYKLDTPMSNLYLSILDKLDIPLEKFGDSTGKLNLAATA